jgi:hypothetical protein
MRSEFVDFCREEPLLRKCHGRLSKSGWADLKYLLVFKRIDMLGLSKH